MDFTRYENCTTRLTQDLVNTRNPLKDRDHLDGVEALKAFLKEHDFSYRGSVEEADLLAVRQLRERLRGIFEADDESAAVDSLNELIVEVGVQPRLTDHDGEPWHLHYTPEGVSLYHRVAAEAAMTLAVIVADEGFERLRVCESDTCADVFVDQSKNRSRRYCDPKVCGNRASVAAYRARQKADVN